MHGFAPDDVWAVGERGTILHFDGASWNAVDSDREYTLFGVWGAAQDDVWAVGGCVCSGSCSVLRHFDGSTWTDVDAGLSRILFKVWGTSAQDVYAVGEAGAILRYDGAWAPMTSGTTERLITVSGRGANDVWAVGGLGRGVVLHHDGSTWRSVGPDLVGGLMGVWATRGSDVVVSGLDGIVAVAGGDQGWAEAESVTQSDLHGVWGDGQGSVLAGGGNLFAVDGPRRGTIVANGAMSQGPPLVWPGD